MTPSPTTTIPPPAAAGTLSIWADDVRAPILTEIGDRFTSDTGIPVAVVTVNRDSIRDDLIAAGGSGAGPDIAYVANDSLGSLVGAGAVAPLDAGLGGKGASFAEVGLDAFRFSGQLYGMPNVGQAAALYYNTALVPSPPKTWTEMKTLAGQLQGAGTVDQGFCLARADPYHSYSILTGFSGYLFAKAPDGSYNFNDVGLDSVGGLASAREIADMLKAGLLKQNTDYATCQRLMGSGRTAFWVTGPWALADLKAASDQSGLHFAVGAIPTMLTTPRPLVGVTGFVLGKFGHNHDAATRFLTDYVAKDDAMTQLWQADPGSPMWKPLGQRMTDPDVIAFRDSAYAGDPMPSFAQMHDVWRAWDAALVQIFDGTEDPAQAYTDAATAIHALSPP